MGWQDDIWNAVSNAHEAGADWDDVQACIDDNEAMYAWPDQEAEAEQAGLPPYYPDPPGLR